MNLAIFDISERNFGESEPILTTAPVSPYSRIFPWEFLPHLGTGG